MPRTAELKAWHRLPPLADVPAPPRHLRSVAAPARADAVRIPGRTRVLPAPALALVGVPVEVEVSALLALGLATWTLADAILPELVSGYRALSYWTAGVVGALLLLASGLVHEVAHCAVARRAGVTPRRVRVLVFGGVTELSGVPRSPGALSRIALAGPLASLLLALAAALTHLVLVEAGADPLTQVLAAVLAVANLALAVFNLVPGLPLDGGAVLEAALWWVHGTPSRAERAARAAGRALGSALIVLAVLASATGYLGSALWLSLIGLVITQHAAD